MYRFLYILLFFSFVACSDIDLAKPEVTVIESQGLQTLCIAEPEVMQPAQNFLFIVDKSGSNVSTPTDPGATRRIKGIMDFYNAQASNPNHQWGLITFQNTSAKSELNPSLQPPGPNFIQGVQSLSQNNTGGTPYLSALDEAWLVVEEEINNPKGIASNFTLIFISDGVPTDVNSSGNPDYFITPTGLDQLKNAVKSIIDLRPSRIRLHTAFYGPGNRTLALQTMANEGKGKFINFSLSQDIDLNQFQLEPTKDPWFIKQLLVYNLNASICTDGTTQVDSDGDGVCDKDERALGLNPTKRYSFNSITNTLGDTIDTSGYSDYFHYRRLVFGETFPACSYTDDEDFDLLNFCEESLIINANSNIIGGSNRPVADEYNPDSDFDGMLDNIELRSFRFTKGMALDSYNLFDSIDGEEIARTQIEQQRNPAMVDAHMPHSDYKWEIESIKPDGSTCYNIDIKSLPVYDTLAIQDDPDSDFIKGEKENLFMVYYLLAPVSEPSKAKVLKTSLQKIKADARQIASGATGTSISFEKSLFSTYKIPQN